MRRRRTTTAAPVIGFVLSSIGVAAVGHLFGFRFALLGLAVLMPGVGDLAVAA